MDYLIKNELKHAIKVTIRQFIYIPIMLAAVMVLALPGVNLIFNRSPLRAMIDWAQASGRHTIIGFSLYDSNIVKFIPFLLMVIAIITAFLLFRFLFSKKAQATYFLTGISRGQLFIIRYLFGAVSLAVSVFLAISISAIINIALFGVADYLISTVLYLFLTMFSMAFCCYSVCVAIMILCGRGIDYFLYAAGAWSAQYLILLFLQNISFAFLPGAPYYFGQGNIQKQSYPSIFEKYAHLSFASVFRKSFETCGTAYGHRDGPDFTMAVEAFVKQPYEIFIMLTVAILFGILGWFLLKKRRAEIAELPNANNLLSTAVSLLAAISLPSCIFLVNRSIGSMILFAVMIILIYCVLASLFRGTARKIYKLLPVSFIAVFASFIFCIVCFFGGLGYSSYIPPIDNIDCVQISYPGHPQYAPANYGYTVQQNSAYYYHYTSLDNLTKLTDKEDIETAVQIHRALIEDGSRDITEEKADNYGETSVYSDIYITYTLKNGHQITRFYRALKLSTLEAVLELELTNEYRSLLESKLRYFCEDKTGWSDETRLAQIFSQSAIYASDNLFSNLTHVSLSDDEKNKLFEAIIHDKSDDTIKERYRSPEECIGVLIISNGTVDMENQDGYTLHNSLDYFGRPPEANHIYVYENDLETIAFLQEKDCLDFFDKAYTITKMELYQFPLYPSQEWRQGHAYNRCFYSRIDTNMASDGNPFVREVSEDEYDKILRDVRLTYLADGGDLVLITTINADGEERIVTKYLPKHHGG